MSPYIYSATALLVLFSVPVQGQFATEARTGIVLLDDYRVVEGVVEPIRDPQNLQAPVKVYRVTAGGRAEMLNANSVLFTGGSRAEAYEYLKKKRKLDAHEDRVWLALWCQKNALILEARAEAKAAIALVPSDTFVQKLAIELENTKVAATDETIRIVRPATKHAQAPTKLVIPGEMIAKTAMVTVSTAQEKAFTGRIHTILNNQCLKCHEVERTKSAFQLERVPEGSTGGAAIKANAIAAAKYARSTDPAVSPLVTYALTPHGGQFDASLTASHPAVKYIAAWAESFPALTPNPTAFASGTQPPAVAKAPAPTATLTPPPATVVPVAGVVVPAPQPIATAPPTVPPVDPNAPKKLKIDLGPGANDPFDPSEFNKLTPVTKPGG